MNIVGCVSMPEVFDYIYIERLYKMRKRKKNECGRRVMTFTIF